MIDVNDNLCQSIKRLHYRDILFSDKKKVFNDLIKVYYVYQILPSNNDLNKHIKDIKNFLNPFSKIEQEYKCILWMTSQHYTSRNTNILLEGIISVKNKYEIINFEMKILEFLQINYEHDLTTKSFFKRTKILLSRTLFETYRSLNYFMKGSLRRLMIKNELKNYFKQLFGTNILNNLLVSNCKSMSNYSKGLIDFKYKKDDEIDQNNSDIIKSNEDYKINLINNINRKKFKLISKEMKQKLPKDIIKFDKTHQNNSDIIKSNKDYNINEINNINQNTLKLIAKQEGKQKSSKDIVMFDNMKYENKIMAQSKMKSNGYNLTIAERNEHKHVTLSPMIIKQPRFINEYFGDCFENSSEKLQKPTIITNMVIMTKDANSEVSDLTNFDDKKIVKVVSHKHHPKSKKSIIAHELKKSVDKNDKPVAKLKAIKIPNIVNFQVGASISHIQEITKDTNLILTVPHAYAKTDSKQEVRSLYSHASSAGSLENDTDTRVGKLLAMARSDLESNTGVNFNQTSNGNKIVSKSKKKLIHRYKLRNPKLFYCSTVLIPNMQYNSKEQQINGNSCDEIEEADYYKVVSKKIQTETPYIISKQIVICLFYNAESQINHINNFNKHLATSINIADSSTFEIDDLPLDINQTKCLFHPINVRYNLPLHIPTKSKSLKILPAPMIIYYSKVHSDPIILKKPIKSYFNIQQIQLFNRDNPKLNDNYSFEKTSYLSDFFSAESTNTLNNRQFTFEHKPTSYYSNLEIDSINYKKYLNNRPMNYEQKSTYYSNIEIDSRNYKKYLNNPQMDYQLKSTYYSNIEIDTRNYKKYLMNQNCYRVTKTINIK